jgi:hypothetical protein
MFPFLRNSTVGFLVAILAFSFTPVAHVVAGPPGSGGFAAFVDDYYAALFAFEPNQATYAGIHDFDDKSPIIRPRTSPAATMHSRNSTSD